MVIDSFGSGGAQRTQISLAEAFTKAGHQVEFFTYKKGSFFENTAKNLSSNLYFFYQEKKGFSLRTLLNLRHTILIGSYDLIISSMHAPSIYSAFAKIKISKGLLILSEESSSAAPVPLFKRLGFYLASLLSNAIVTKSYHEAQEVAKRPGLSNKVHAIWPGIELQTLNYNKNIVHNKELKLLIVARVSYPKNGLNLLRALKFFYDRNGWIPKVSWAGREDSGLRDQEMLCQMKDYLISHPKINAQWSWLGEVKDVQNLYENHDALVLVSIYEGFPTVIVEAMLYGCFVIASDICDNKIVFGEDERGLLCNPLSPESICSAIEKLNMMNISQKLNVIEKARKFAEVNFKQQRMEKDFETLCNKLNS